MKREMKKSMKELILDELGFISSFEVTGGIQDTVSPSLSSFGISNPVVDLSNGDATLRFTAGATDDISGVSDIYASWRSPSGEQSFSLSANDGDDLIDGTKNQGTWRSYSGELNRYSELGTWRLSYLEIDDEAGNEKEYERADLDELGFISSFEVTGGIQDTVSPSLSSFGISNPVVDLSKGDATLRFTAGATDNISGVSDIYASWRSPSGEQSFSLSANDGDDLIDGTKNQGTWRSYSGELNRYSELGTWRLSYLEIDDEAGNEKEYERADLDELGYMSSFEVTTNGGVIDPIPEPEEPISPRNDVTGDSNDVIVGNSIGNSVTSNVDNSVTSNVDNSVTSNVDNNVTNNLDNSLASVDNSVTNVDNSVTNVDNSVTIINNIDNSATSSDNSSTNYTDNSISATDNSTNVYNTFSLERIPVDLSQIIKSSSKGAELVEGSKKDDVIGFGRGRHRLFGDRGEDIFVFNKKDKFGPKGADRIIDFDPAKDQLLVGKKALKGIGNKPEFAAASNRKELKALQREDMELVYFEPKGQLYYNQNDEGRGFGKKGGLFAILQGAPEMTEDSIGLVGKA